MNIRHLARQIDISCVQAFHSQRDVETLAERAIEGRFVSAHVLPQWMPTLRGLLDGTGVLAGGPAGFPSGGSLPGTKLYEVQGLLDVGAQEIDVVVNIGLVRSGRFADVSRELEPIVDAVGGAVPLRGIIEVGYLDDEQIRNAACAVADAGIGWVKSATGWSGRPTETRHIELMAQGAGGRAKLKAAGGIRTLRTVEEMIALGVSRFGMNADVAIALTREARDRF